MALTPGTDLGRSVKSHDEKDQLTNKGSFGGASSRLLQLPAELRNYIFGLVVLKTFAIDILDSRDAKKTSVRVVQPALARVSRQLRQEVLPMFYGNAFEIDCTGYSRYLRPGRVLMGLDEREFFCTMERNQHTIDGFDAVRKWLQRIGVSNRTLLGEVLVCCAEEDASQLLEIALVRFDFRHQCLTACADYPLLQGWRWMGKADVNNLCSANVCYGAGLQHYRIALED